MFKNYNKLGTMLMVAVLVGGTLLTGYRATGQQQGAPEGLSGMLPKTPPQDLVPEDVLQGLGPNWSNWANEYKSLVTELYNPGTSLQRQQELVKTLEVKQQTISTALGSPSYKMIWSELRQLQGSLSRRIGIMKAAMATLSQPAKSPSADYESNLQKAVGKAETFLASYDGGEAWKSYFKIEQLKSGELTDEQLQAVHAKLIGKQAYNEDQLAFISHAPIKELANAIEQKLSIKDLGSPDEELRNAVAGLLKSIELAEGNAIESDSPVPSIADAMADVAAYASDSGEQFSKVISQNYNQPNFVVHFPQALLNEMNNEGRIECGPVRDCILGATVRGTQQTNSDVDLQLQPSNDAIKLGISLTGSTNSKTTGTTSQATIYTKGNHTFSGYKTLYFDGYTVSTTYGNSLSVNPHNYNYAARIHHRGLFGIIGKFGDKIALQKANEKKPQAEAIAASRVRDRVAPEFESGVNDLAAKANSQIKDSNSLLGTLDYEPDYVIANSTSQAAYYGSRLGKSYYTAAPTAPVLDVPANLMTVQVHESAINNMFKRDQFLMTFFDRNGGAEGEIVQYTIPDLIDKLKADVLASTGEELDFQISDEVRNNPNKFTLGLGDQFAQLDPLTIEMKHDQIMITLRGAIEIPKENGESDKLPYAEIPLLFNTSEDDGTAVLSLDDDYLLRNAKLLFEYNPFPEAESKPRLIATRIFKDRVVKEFSDQVNDLTIEKAPLTINGKPVFGEGDYDFIARDFELTEGWLTITGRPKKKSNVVYASVE